MMKYNKNMKKKNILFQQDVCPLPYEQDDLFLRMFKPL